MGRVREFTRNRSSSTVEYSIVEAAVQQAPAEVTASRLIVLLEKSLSTLLTMYNPN